MVIIMKTCKYKSLTAIVAILLTIAFIEIHNTPSEIIEATLGGPLPKSACNVNAYSSKVGNLKGVQLWAVMSVSQKEADQFMMSLGVDFLPNGCWFEFPIPKSTINWWDPPNNLVMKTLPNQWMRVDAGWRGGVSRICSVWHDGRLYIYYLGLPRQMLSSDSGGWGRRIHKTEK